MPGAGYTREFTYNEEAQLLGISYSGTLAYQYAYGADGNRRWSKDIANNLWTWYPCGVACGAGEMVEETSDLTGSSWATSGQYLRAGGGCSSLLVRRKSSTDDEYHHQDMVGVFGVITGASVEVLSSNLYDLFSYQQYMQGSTITGWRFDGSKIMDDGMTGGQDGLSYYFPQRGLELFKASGTPTIASCVTLQGKGCSLASNAPFLCKQGSINIPGVKIDTCEHNCPNKRNCKTVNLPGGMEGSITVKVMIGKGTFKLPINISCPVHCKNATQTICECGPVKKKVSA